MNFAKTLTTLTVLLACANAFAYSIGQDVIKERQIEAIKKDRHILAMSDGARLSIKENNDAFMVSFKTSEGETCELKVTLKDGARQIPGFIGNGTYSPEVASVKIENNACK